MAVAADAMPCHLSLYESVLRAHVPGRKGDRTDAKKNKKTLSLKVVRETLDEFIYFLEKQKQYTR